MLKLVQQLSRVPRVNMQNVVKRFAHFDPLHTFPPDPDKLPSYEITKDPKEWEFVERLLPKSTVPDPPTENKRYPSGWKPQTVKPGEYPYYIARNSNHGIPVYLRVTLRGQKRRTYVRNIHGDIYALANELKEYLQSKRRRRVEMKVSEILGEIRLRGDYVSDIRIWLEERNF